MIMEPTDWIWAGVVVVIVLGAICKGLMLVFGRTDYDAD